MRILRFWVNRRNFFLVLMAVGFWAASAVSTAWASAPGRETDTIDRFIKADLDAGENGIYENAQNVAQNAMQKAIDWTVSSF